jgi:hypothetical protein
MRAFSGFLSRRDGVRFVPSLQFSGTIPIFVRNAGDLREQGPATPKFIGEAMTRQPEFAACMVKKVEELIYGGYPVPPTVHHELMKGFVRDKNFGKLVEDAVVRRFVPEGNGRSTLVVDDQTN